MASLTKFVEMSPRLVPSVAWIFVCQLAFTVATVRPFDNGELQVSVTQWLDGEDAAEYGYGHISGWDTSMVTDMSSLFQNATSFNTDIGSWN
eukprot:3448344-Amphidinium_carterae.1